MKYRRMGHSGLKISELSFGAWITFGEGLGYEEARRCMHYAYDEGVNFFDNAEAYGTGVAEAIMGEVLRDFRRESVVISTKIFWGGDGPNDQGLSRKHLIEGTRASLRRLRLDYVDILYCHRPDPETPIEETLGAIDYILRQGWALYWGTSEWSATQLMDAYEAAEALGIQGPSVEQPEYNMFRRDRVEEELVPLYDRYGLGTTTWSPLDSGILTGKYDSEIPEGSRLARHPQLQQRMTQNKLDRVRALEALADEIGVTMAQLAIAWCLKNANVSSVITGASRMEQLSENLGAVQVCSRLDDELMERVEVILGPPVAK